MSGSIFCEVAVGEIEDVWCIDVEMVSIKNTLSAKRYPIPTGPRFPSVRFRLPMSIRRPKFYSTDRSILNGDLERSDL